MDVCSVQRCVSEMLQPFKQSKRLFLIIKYFVKRLRKKQKLDNLDSFLAR